MNTSISTTTSSRMNNVPPGTKVPFVIKPPTERILSILNRVVRMSPSLEASQHQTVVHMRSENAIDSGVVNNFTNSIQSHFEEGISAVLHNVTDIAADAANFTVDQIDRIPATTTKASTVTSEQHCPPANIVQFLIPQEPYCDWTWDKFLCWPPTPAGTLARMRCPPGHGIDVTKFAERRCGLDGRWVGKADGSHPNGWTNYTPCYTPEILDLMERLYSGGNGDVIKVKFEVIERTRSLEIAGLVVSLCALLLSLIIFYNFRTLRNNRTRIHKNLFIAMVIQVVIRLTLYFDQAIIRQGSQIAGNGSTNGIENTPYLCEASYVLLEYARTAMFMWMFIEGLYLHNVVTVTVFQGRFPIKVYAILGWGTPVLMTAIWAGVTSQYKGHEKCWWNYNLTPYYWILEGPRLAVILFNFCFLLNIIRVLVVKLRQTQTSDVEQVRKAVRAAVVLLPLLGITNLLHMTEAPLNKTAWEFALWSYITHFLTSFQGLFIAMIYCFLNGEVRAALLKSLAVYMSLRGHPDWIPRRASMFSAAYNTAPETEGPNNDSTRQDTNSRRHSSNHYCINNNNNSTIRTNTNNNTNQHHRISATRRNWMMSLCFRGQKVLRERPASSVPPETNV